LKEITIWSGNTKMYPRLLKT